MSPKMDKKGSSRGSNRRKLRGSYMGSSKKEPPSLEEALARLDVEDSSAAEESSYDIVGDKAAYGNAGGLSLLQEFDTMKNDMKDVKEKLNDLTGVKEELKETKELVKVLQVRSDTYASQSVSYRRIRHRFFETFLRNSEEEYGQKRVREGNAAAPQGDAVADAMLFETEERTDVTNMVRIYGLGPEMVLPLYKQRRYELINIINEYGTFVVSLEPISDELKGAFKSFTWGLAAHMALNDGEAPDLADAKSPLAQKYYAYLNKRDEYLANKMRASIN